MLQHRVRGEELPESGGRGAVVVPRVDVDVAGYDDRSAVTGDDMLQLLLQFVEVCCDPGLRLDQWPVQRA